MIFTITKTDNGPRIEPYKYTEEQKRQMMKVYNTYGKNRYFKYLKLSFNKHGIVKIDKLQNEDRRKEP